MRKPSLVSSLTRKSMTALIAVAVAFSGCIDSEPEDEPVHVDEPTPMSPLALSALNVSGFAPFNLELAVDLPGDANGTYWTLSIYDVVSGNATGNTAGNTTGNNTTPELASEAFYFTDGTTATNLTVTLEQVGEYWIRATSQAPDHLESMQEFGVSVVEQPPAPEVPAEVDAGPSYFLDTNATMTQEFPGVGAAVRAGILAGMNGTYLAYYEVPVEEGAVALKVSTKPISDSVSDTDLFAYGPGALAADGVPVDDEYSGSNDGDADETLLLEAPAPGTYTVAVLMYEGSGDVNLKIRVTY